MENTDPQITRSAPVGQQATRGFAWLLGQTLTVKVLTMGGQVVLAWLLLPEDFGVVGLAYTLAAFAGLINAAGLRDVLIRRQQHIRCWGNVAFWLSLSLGLLASLAMAAMAPIAAALYDMPSLVGIVLVMAATIPLTSLHTVPWTVLQQQLRFRATATIGLIEGGGAVVLAICFAWLGFGAYSFVLPRLATAAVQAAVLWSMVRVPVRWSLQRRRWRLLIGDTATLVLAQLALTVIAQVDRMLLGLVHTAGTVGIYYFAFNLSTQAVQLLSLNLLTVLLPSLSRLQDDIKRQTQAFFSVIRLLALVSMPACFLQAALAGPIIRILFDSKWEPAIPVLRTLSVAMAFAIIAGPAHSMLKAQGRFRAFLICATAQAIMVVASTSIAVSLGGADAVAAATLLCFGVFGPICIRLAGAAGGGTWRNVLDVHLPPMICGASAVIAAWYAVTLLLPDGRGGDWGSLFLVPILAGILYMGMARMLMKDRWRELSARLRSLLPSRDQMAEQLLKA